VISVLAHGEADFQRFSGDHLSWQIIQRYHGPATGERRSEGSNSGSDSHENPKILRGYNHFPIYDFHRISSLVIGLSVNLYTGQ
jgi:hypothetical protein